MSIQRKLLREAFQTGGRPDLAPVHPGELLKEDFLDPLGISQTQLAQAIGVPINRINEIVKGKRNISPETAWLLAEYFDMSVEYWSNIQQYYDLCQAHAVIANKLAQVRPHAQEMLSQRA
ncbi:MAG: HigA family addiction module antidote protein [Candidatus Sericytochromatia bacterium]|nr:HigA family addiction module antidote protein [Candidatus Sericytochromatia bacterium]